MSERRERVGTYSPELFPGATVIVHSLRPNNPSGLFSLRPVPLPQSHPYHIQPSLTTESLRKVSLCTVWDGIGRVLERSEGNELSGSE